MLVKDFQDRWGKLACPEEEVLHYIHLRKCKFAAAYVYELEVATEEKQAYY